MRRSIQWRTRREDGTHYEVRVSLFGGKFRFQFREKNMDEWDYKREPAREDLEKLLEAILGRYQRQQVGPREVEMARRLLSP